MQEAKIRTDVIEQIRTRAEAVGIGTGWLGDAGLLQLSVASATRAAEDLIGVTFSRSLQLATAGRTKQLAITSDEWATLFGVEARPTGDAAATLAVAADASFKDTAQRLEDAVRCTVGEVREARAWAAPRTRLAAYVSVHTTDFESFLKASIGNFVRGDARRLEELTAELDDEGVDLLTLSATIAALASSV